MSKLVWVLRKQASMLAQIEGEEEIVVSLRRAAQEIVLLNKQLQDAKQRLAGIERVSHKCTSSSS